jgi:hypothetical protein
VQAAILVPNPANVTTNRAFVAIKVALVITKGAFIAINRAFISLRTPNSRDGGRTSRISQVQIFKIPDSFGPGKVWGARKAESD